MNRKLIANSIPSNSMDLEVRQEFTCVPYFRLESSDYHSTDDIVEGMHRYCASLTGSAQIGNEFVQTGFKVKLV